MCSVTGEAGEVKVITLTSHADSVNILLCYTIAEEVG